MEYELFFGEEVRSHEDRLLCALPRCNQIHTHLKIFSNFSPYRGVSM